MKTAHLGRRLGDWLGIVPEDDVPMATSPDYFDLDRFDRLPPAPAERTITVESRVIDATPAPTPTPSPTLPRFEPTATTEMPAPSPVRSDAPIPEPAKTVRTFRDVVNQRRAETQRRAQYPQAPPRW